MPLLKGSKKYSCPKCNRKTFVPYVDSVNMPINTTFGRCDREVKCGYHQTPTKKDTTPQAQPKKHFTTFGVFNKRVYKPYIGNHEYNTLYQSLINLGFDNVKKAFNLYYVGATNNGYCLFPFIDTKNILRCVQAKLFDTQTARTVTNSWLHSIIKTQSEWLKEYVNADLKVSCFFGEHLLNQYKDATVYIVEACKTCIIATLYYGLPKDSNKIFLASYSRQGIQPYKTKVLQNRNVMLLPDSELKSEQLWQNIAYKNNYHIKLLDYTNLHRVQGYDIADLIIDRLKMKPNENTP